MEQNKCCICGLHIGTINTYKKPFHGGTYRVCQYCADALGKVESGNAKKIESGRKYLRTRMNKGENAPEALPMIKEALGEAVTMEEIEEAVAVLPSIQGESKKSETVGNGAVVLAGFCFLILSVILYFVSVNNTYGVANIPSTVYSAASFVAAIVCFAAGRIIKAINTKE